MVEYVPRGWLWVAPIEPTIGYISLEELVCEFITFASRVE